MNRSAVPAALLAVCCALLAASVLRTYHVPLLASAAAQNATYSSATSSVVPFDPFRGASLRPALPGERQAAVSSIALQLSAFSKDDYARAAQFQSAGLRANFSSLAGFRHMMLSVYPQFAHSRKVVYGFAQAEQTGRHVMVPITITGRDGTVVQATYVMVREGSLHRPVYRVEGVLGGSHPLPPVGTGAVA